MMTMMIFLMIFMMTIIVPANFHGSLFHGHTQEGEDTAFSWLRNHAMLTSFVRLLWSRVLHGSEVKVLVTHSMSALLEEQLIIIVLHQRPTRRSLKSLIDLLFGLSDVIKTPILIAVL